jgi:hypothetical protein
MADANALADELATAFESLFDATHKDQIEALIAQRAAMDHGRRTRLFAALHRLQEQAHNALAELSRDAAWGP